MITYETLPTGSQCSDCPYWRTLQHVMEFLPSEFLEAVRSTEDGK